MEFVKVNLINLSIFFILIFLIGYLFVLNFLKQKSFNINFRLLKTKKYFYIKYIFLFFSFFIILLSIFDFKIAKKSTQKNINGIDIIFVVDVSKSMNVADITDGNYNYTRLDVIKNSIGEYVTKNKQNRFGLVIFAGDAVSCVPLTFDNNIFLTFLPNVNYKNLIVQGTNFEKAINLGTTRFDISENRTKAIVFISDGGDEDYKMNLNKIKKSGINYNIIGIGTEKGGKIIIGRDPFQRFVYQKYKGKEIISKLNEKNLKKLANFLDGKYIKISKIDDIFKLDKNFEKLEKKAMKSGIYGERIDGTRFLSFVSFFFFLLFFILYVFENKFYKLIVLKDE